MLPPTIWLDSMPGANTAPLYPQTLAPILPLTGSPVSHPIQSGARSVTQGGAASEQRPAEKAEPPRSRSEKRAGSCELNSSSRQTPVLWL